MSRSSDEKPSATPSASTPAQRVQDRPAGQSEAGTEAAAKALHYADAQGAKEAESWEALPQVERDGYCEAVQPIIAAYLAAVSPVSVEGEDEARWSDVGFASILPEHGRQARAAWEAIDRPYKPAWAYLDQGCRAALRRSLATSPSSPTG